MLQGAWTRLSFENGKTIVETHLLARWHRCNSSIAWIATRQIFNVTLRNDVSERCIVIFVTYDCSPFSFTISYRNLELSESFNPLPLETFFRLPAICLRCSIISNKMTQHCNHPVEMVFCWLYLSNMLAFRNKLRDVATYFLLFLVFFLLFCCGGTVGGSSLLLCHSTWSLAFLLWTEQLVKEYKFHI